MIDREKTLCDTDETVVCVCVCVCGRKDGGGGGSNKVMPTSERIVDVR